MAIWFSLNEAVVLILFCGISYCEDDILENLKLKRDDPPELVDFVQAILQRKNEFKKIRDAAKRLHLKTSDVYLDQTNVLKGLDNGGGSKFSPGAPQRSSILKRRKRHRKSRFSHNRPVNDIYPYSNNNDRRKALSERFHENIGYGNREQENNINRFRRGLDLNDYNSGNDFGSSNIKIIPRSESGVRLVPGNKFIWSKALHSGLNASRLEENHYYIKQKDRLSNIFKTNLRKKNILPHKTFADIPLNKNKLLLWNEGRKKRLVKVDIANDNNLIGSIKLSDIAQPMRLTIKGNNVKISNIEPEHPSFAAKQQYYVPSNINETAPFSKKYIPNFHGARCCGNSSHNATHGKLPKHNNTFHANLHNKPTKVRDEDNMNIFVRTERTNFKPTIFQKLRQQEKVNTLEDVDLPTSAIEQHRLSTKPYMTFQPSVEDDRLPSGLDLTTPFAFLFATGIVKSGTYKSTIHPPLFNLGRMGNLLNEQNLRNPKTYLRRVQSRSHYYAHPNSMDKYPYHSKDFRDPSLSNYQASERTYTENGNHPGRIHNKFYSHQYNNQNFQGRKLQSIYEPIDFNESIFGETSEDTRYGNLDYENGEHYGGINEIRNKIRVKRIDPNLLPIDNNDEYLKDIILYSDVYGNEGSKVQNRIRVKRSFPNVMVQDNDDDDDEYLEDLVNNYNLSLKRQPPDDDYDEEEDSSVPEKVISEKIKQISNTSDQHKNSGSSKSQYPLNETLKRNPIPQLIVTNITKSSDINSVAALHGIDNFSALHSNSKKDTKQKICRNICNCKEKNLQDGCKNQCKNCNSGNPDNKASNNTNYKTCKNWHNENKTDYNKQEGNGKSTTYTAILSKKPDIVESGHIRMQKNSKTNRMDEDDSDNDETEKGSEKYHSKRVLTSGTTPLEEHPNPKQESAVEEVQFLFTKSKPTSSTAAIITISLPEEMSISTTTCTTSTTEPTVTTTTKTTTTTTTETSETCSTTDTFYEYTLINVSKARRKFLESENDKKQQALKHDEKNNNNHGKYKKLESDELVLEENKNHLRTNHKEVNGYFHHPTKSRKVHHKKLTTERTFKFSSTKSHLLNIFTNYHLKHNMNDFKLNVEEATEFRNSRDPENEQPKYLHARRDDGNSLNLSKLRRPKEETRKRVWFHKQRHKATSPNTKLKSNKVKREGIRKKDTKGRDQEYKDESYAEFSVYADKIKMAESPALDVNKKAVNLSSPFDSVILDDAFVSSTEKNIFEEKLNPQVDESEDINDKPKKDVKHIFLDSVESFADVVEDDPSSRKFNKRELNERRKKFVNGPRSRIRKWVNAPARRYRRHNKRRYEKSEPVAMFENTKVYGMPFSHIDSKQNRWQRSRSSNVKRTAPKDQSVKETKNDNNNNKNMKQWIYPDKPPGGKLLDVEKNKGKCPKVSSQKDASQMRDALNGHLASIIVENIFDRVNNHPQLKARFSEGLHRTYNIKDEINDLNEFRNNETELDVKHTEEMLHNIMTVLNKIIMDQVARRTCKRLSPELQQYLKTITQGANATFEDEEDGTDEYPLPLINSKKVQKSVNPNQGTYLFTYQDSLSDAQRNEEEIKKRIHMVRDLLAKYRNMSTQSQVKVRDVEAYLKKHLTLLQNMLKVVEQEKQNDGRDVHKRNKLIRKNADYNNIANIESKMKSLLPEETIGTKRDLVMDRNGAAAKKIQKYHDKISMKPVHPWQKPFIQAEEVDKHLPNLEVVNSENVQPFDIDKILDSYIKLENEKENSATARSAKTLHPHSSSKNSETFLEALDNGEKKSKTEKKREISHSQYDNLHDGSVSRQYRKLATAAQHIRKKKQIEERLGKLFGNSKKRTTKSKNPKAIKKKYNHGPDFSNIAFEKPVVFKLEK